MASSAFVSLSEPSVILDRLFTPNPAYGKFDALVDVDLMAIYDMIDLDDPDLLQNLESNPDVMAILDGVIDRYEQTPDMQPAMPPCPQPQQLYRRIETNSKVQDLGSGDGKKASLCQAKVKMCDINPGSSFVKQADVNELRFETEGVLYTSFNALTQFATSTVEELEDSEGLHLLPDMEYVKCEMGSEVVKQDVYKTVHKGVTYIDKDHGIVGDEVTTGYVGYNTYVKRRLNYEFSGNFTKVQPFDVQIENTSYQLPGVATPKYDGLAMRFRTYPSGHVVLSNRKGTGYVFNTCGEPKFDLLMERLPKNGIPQAFVLIRVLYYNGRIPFHGLNGLRKFCKRVKIKIDGKPLVAPGHEILLGHPVDGLIYRVEGVDYRLKDVLTVDVTYNQLLQFRTNYALEVEVLGDCDRKGILEFAITRREDGRFIARYICDRPDKLNSTSDDNMMKIFERSSVEVAHSDVHG